MAYVPKAYVETTRGFQEGLSRAFGNIFDTIALANQQRKQQGISGVLANPDNVNALNTISPNQRKDAVISDISQYDPVLGLELIDRNNQLQNQRYSIDSANAIRARQLELRSPFLGAAVQSGLEATDEAASQLSFLRDSNNVVFADQLDPLEKESQLQIAKAEGKVIFDTRNSYQQLLNDLNERIRRESQRVDQLTQYPSISGAIIGQVPLARQRLYGESTGQAYATPPVVTGQKLLDTYDPDSYGILNEDIGAPLPGESVFRRGWNWGVDFFRGDR